MPKLALLMGVSGSGKSYVIDHLGSTPQVLTIDLIRKDAIRALCSPDDFPGDSVNRWPIWDKLLTRSDVHTGIAHGITQRCPKFDANKYTLAEGGLLAHLGFLQAFLETLDLLGFQSEQTKLFWLDPSPEVVLENILRRKRPNQMHYQPQDAERAVAWYRSQASVAESRRVENASQALLEINEYFNEK